MCVALMHLMFESQTKALAVLSAWAAQPAARWDNRCVNPCAGGLHCDPPFVLEPDYTRTTKGNCRCVKPEVMHYPLPQVGPSSPRTCGSDPDLVWAELDGSTETWIIRRGVEESRADVDRDRVRCELDCIWIDMIYPDGQSVRRIENRVLT